MTRARPFVVASALVSACGAGGSSGIDVVANAIIHGSPAPLDTAVVSVSGFCTGTIIDARAVLTAAHCLHNHTSLDVFIEDGTNTTTVPVDLGSSVIHPSYNGLQHDLAVIALSQSTAVTPIGLSTSAPAQAEVIRFVGYGKTNYGPSGSDGDRLTLTTTVASIDNDFVFSGPSTCAGDSGGPGFVVRAGREVIAGVTAFGDVECRFYAAAARVDIDVAFIQGAVAAINGAASADAGAGDAAIDAGAIDASATDASAIDASATDASATDANMIDADMIDADMIDANIIDAGTIDASASDANASDANVPTIDAGAGDAGAGASDGCSCRASHATHDPIAILTLAALFCAVVRCGARSNFPRRKQVSSVHAGCAPSDRRRRSGCRSRR